MEKGQMATGGEKPKEVEKPAVVFLIFFRFRFFFSLKRLTVS